MTRSGAREARADSDRALLATTFGASLRHFADAEDFASLQQLVAESEDRDRAALRSYRGLRPTEF